MRIMGADSVDYHRATVLARGDDHPGQALAYYASRGETPLLWGGAGARLLGPQGAVTDEQYSALYGPGGACDPTTGERLVHSKRPGLELVISAHKSVAELGLIGRAEDMHAIMDAERDATLAYLDDLTRRLGGRRGEAAVRTPTEGLIYVTARHATSRVGDLMPRWVAEIGEVGWSVESLGQAIDREAAAHRPPSPTLSAEEVRSIVNQVLDPDGALAARKVFTRRDVVVAVAPSLYGRDPGELARVVDRTLADPEATTLLRLAVARERAYATAVASAR